MAGRLAGKVAVITGGSGGIGLATGRLFAAEGALVVLVDLDQGRLQAAVAETGSAAVSHQVADVSDEAQMRAALAATVAQHGRLDVLFCNAGTEGRVAPLAEMPVEDFDRVMAVNVRGVFLGLKHALPLMQHQGGGSIIITSSVAGVRGAARLAPYAASKHAVVGLMRSAVLEAGSSGARINTVHPAPIETRMMRAIEHGRAPGAEAAARQMISSRIPQGRYGTADEVAATVLFLASDDSRYCTGGQYAVDGGMTAG
jgi:NAD(P)-dependent dehydrogenase (short-subunit alcohol dehydrogenase family)